MAARVGTFSYRKDFAIQQFQEIWHAAFERLRESDRWLFIGYSMPTADFEFKQILKSAEMARRRAPQIQVILKEDTAAEKRHVSFFGLKNTNVDQTAFDGWYDNAFAKWLG